ncbi:MAG: NACHT domain-containing protein [Polyangiaceae bacterium]
MGSARAAHLPNRTFVGRADDVVALEARLREARIVTLLGPPGVGKTHLAAHVARRAAEGDAYPGGVHWCALTSVRDATSLVGAIREATARVPAPEPHDDDLAALRSRGRSLIVLDDADAQVELLGDALDDWQQSLPEVTWLVTSRRRLARRGEHCFDIGPLPTPEVFDPTGDAATLFALYARSVERDFSWEGQEAELAALLRHLDGLPLAIELAAARLRVLSLVQLEAALRESYQILGLDSPLHRAIESSWTQLAEPLRRGLAQCTAFRGGFGLDATGAVVEVEGPLLDLLQDLRDASLLRATVNGPEARYEMLGVIDAFVTERADPALSRAARERHEAHFLARASAWHREGDVDALRREHHNLVAIHRRAMDSARPRAALEVAVALSLLAPSLGYGWCEALITTALDAAGREALPEPLVARALEARGTLRRFLGRPAESEDDLRACLALAQGDAPLEARALSGLGNGAAARGCWSEARDRLSEALALLATTSDLAAQGRTRVMRAATWFNEDEPDRAARDLEDGLALLREVGDRHFEAIAAASLGFVELARGRTAVARTLLDEGRAMLQSLDDEHWSAVTQGYLALSEHEQEAPPATVRALLDEAVTTLARLGVKRAEGVTRGQRGLVRLEQGDLEGASADLYEALRLHRAQAPDHVGLTLAWLAALAAEKGELTSAEAHLERAREALEPHRRPGFRAALDIVGVLVGVHAARVAVANGTESPETPPPSPAPHPGLEPRAAQRLEARARRALEATRDRARRELDRDVLVIHEEGRWFRAPGANEGVSLRRRRALGPILGALGQARRQQPGRALAIDALVAAGWPSERVMARAGIDRVYNAVATLRRLGLRDAILRRDNGYLLDPDTELVMTREELDLSAHG